MKGNIAPHLVWAVTLLAAIGMLLYFVGEVLEEKSEVADELITVLQEALEKNVTITITVDDDGSVAEEE